MRKFVTHYITVYLWIYAQEFLTQVVDCSIYQNSRSFIFLGAS